MSDNIIAQSLICLEVAMLSQEPISTGFVDMRASPGFPVWSPAFLFFFSKKSGRERALSFSLPSPALSPFPPAPRHLFRSTNFHLKHVELILPLHRFPFFPSFWGTSDAQFQSDRKTQQQNILNLSPQLQPLIPLCHRLCVSVFSFLFLFYPALLSLLFEIKKNKKNLSDRD